MNCPSQQRRISGFTLRPAFGFRLSAFGIQPSFGFRFSGFGFHLRSLLSGLVVALAFEPDLLWACAACAGQSDSPMAKGMNWGIFSLLAVIGVVLGGVVSFFVYLAKRSATVAAEPAKPKQGRASVPASPDSRRSPEELGLAGTLAFHSTAPLLESTRSVL